MTRMQRRLARTAIVGIVSAALLSACSQHSEQDQSAPLPLRWERVQLPGDVTPVSLTPMGDGLLVGARDEHAHVAPRLLVLADARWTSVPLRPKSYYAYRARWRTVIADGNDIFAVGDAPGGAHSNPRWTTWSGTADGVTEYTQTFETFGGWGAGGITALTFSAGKPVIVGSWSSDDAGLDIVFWTPHGHDWSRGSSTGTALASNEHALNVIRAVGEDPGGIAIAGAVTLLEDGHVDLAPAIWRGSSPGSSWARVDLPTDGQGQATGVRCRQAACLAAGYVDDRLAAWSVGRDGATRVDDLPDVPVTSQSAALVGPPGSRDTSVLTTSGGRSVIVSERAGEFTLVRGPAGTATSWAQAGGKTYVITTGSNGASALWSGHLPAP